MRFMMLMMPGGCEKAKADTPPTKEQVAAMMKYTDARKQAGMPVALDGLHPPAVGARVRFSERKAKVSLGPLPDASETLGGYGMIHAKPKEQAIERASRCPAQNSDLIEIRHVQELSDYPPEIQAVASQASDARALEKRRGRDSTSGLRWSPCAGSRSCPGSGADAGLAAFAARQ